MSKHGKTPNTTGADQDDDDKIVLVGLEQRSIASHVAQTDKEPTDPATARNDRREGIESRLRMRDRMQSIEYRVSQRVRKKLQECYGWRSTMAGLDRSRWVGRWKMKQYIEISLKAYKLPRIQKLRTA